MKSGLKLVMLNISDLAEKLHWINESFRKYEIDDLGCQMFIACEAGHHEDKEHPLFGALTSYLHSLFRFEPFILI